MKTTKQVIETILYTSDIHPEIVTDDNHMAEVIEWADANPTIWKIVMGTKSKAFGRTSSTYRGYMREPTTSGALERAAAFKSLVETPAEFWQWRARFTLEHYNDKGFKGGFFQQWDGNYERGCCVLDYTPKTAKEVIENFKKWCGSTFETKAVWIDGETVWTTEP